MTIHLHRTVQLRTCTVQASPQFFSLVISLSYRAGRAIYLILVLKLLLFGCTQPACKSVATPTKLFQWLFVAASPKRSVRFILHSSFSYFSISLLVFVLWSSRNSLEYLLLCMIRGSHFGRTGKWWWHSSVASASSSKSFPHFTFYIPSVSTMSFFRVQSTQNQYLKKHKYCKKTTAFNLN